MILVIKNMDIRDVLEHIISVSELGRGKASQVIQNVEKNGDQYIVVKNNKPQAIIVSIEEYTELLRIRDAYHAFKSAEETLIKKVDEGKTIAEVMDSLGITDEDLDVDVNLEK